MNDLVKERARGIKERDNSMKKELKSLKRKKLCCGHHILFH